MYTYDRLCDDIAYLGYNGIDVGNIGKSALGNNIPYIHLGDYGKNQIFITGGIHSRENVTSLLVIRQAFRLAFSRESLEGGIYFIPMLNPDGALLIERGADIDPCRKQFLLDLNRGSNDFGLYKANINGVDLNNNFDARFGLGAGQKSEPNTQGYPGPYPFSEPETRALRDFTYLIKPCATLSYHALGRELYYYFFQNDEQLNRDKEIAKVLADKLQYKLVDGDLNSTGGYKDWCISALHIPSFTVEIIADTHSHPLNSSVLEEDYEVNKDIPALLSKLMTDYL